ncbi:MAG: hypothetical protein DI622_09885 [Chryseobacterium sp.]|uniref:hypothetical protein n=1 Tax=Chryseobacterium sp. TaxID=1871047 RepID=UPI000DB43582|nr:hypothetical protein [Chryseobacterium sp.]MPS66514.1 hypothetical protein [Chryseobacterium sp.]PZU18544.1 MAG: hypothetical protein DI622_09885 [Chryseobacterium sp.]
MQELFVKKYWNEEDILFYIHFQNGEAIRQIEIKKKEKILLTLDNPNHGESMLYDQSIDDLNLNESDFITNEEFNKVWNN